MLNSVNFPAGLRIAHVCSFDLNSSNQAATAALKLSQLQADRGAQVLLIAPSTDSAQLAKSQSLLNQLAERDYSSNWLSSQHDPKQPLVIYLGELLAIPQSRSDSSRSSGSALTLTGSKQLADLLENLSLDLVHAHEPLGNSLATAALRFSHSLNVASFYSCDQRRLTAPTSKRFARILGRADLRIAASQVASRNAQRLAIDHHEPLIRLLPATNISTTSDNKSLGDVKTNPSAKHSHSETSISQSQITICLAEGEERAARRVILRALKLVATEPNQTDWSIQVAAGPSSTPVLLPATLKDRIKADCTTSDNDPTIKLFGSVGTSPAAAEMTTALQAGNCVIAPEIDIYEELLQGGSDPARGLLYRSGSAESLAEVIAFALNNRSKLDSLSQQGEAFSSVHTWDGYEAWLLDQYKQLLDRRHNPERFSKQVLKRLATRQLINVDLHMHTNHSHDCATPVEVLLESARRAGLDAIAVTDHNEVSGAHAAAELAAEFDMKVIVAEEVKTADQGEVIGLFINEKIPKGVTMQEAISDIRRQGGLVYIPHPFDRMHSVPDYKHLLDFIDQIDIIEIFNPRVAISSFNQEALQFANKYRMIAAAGSDSHVTQGLGSVKITMPDFDGPEEFLASLAQGQIQTKSGTLVYVQALKFLENVATPGPARELLNDLRVKKAVRRR